MHGGVLLMAPSQVLGAAPALSHGPVGVCARAVEAALLV